MKQTSKWDKRGLISEALKMEALSPQETRSIFFDWAFGLEDTTHAAEAAKDLLDLHKTDANADSEMIRLLTEAMSTPPQDRRRSGRGRRATDQ